MVPKPTGSTLKTHFSFFNFLQPKMKTKKHNMRRNRIVLLHSYIRTIFELLSNIEYNIEYNILYRTVYRTIFVLYEFLTIVLLQSYSSLMTKKNCFCLFVLLIILVSSFNCFFFVPQSTQLSHTLSTKVRKLVKSNLVRCYVVKNRQNS